MGADVSGASQSASNHVGADVSGGASQPASADVSADEDVVIVEKSTVRITTCPVNEISPGSWPLVVLDLHQVWFP